jgi:hypothetical protein
VDQVVEILRVVAPWALVLASLLLSACGPDCRAACRHMLEDCGVDRPGLDVEDCTRQCSSFLNHYEDDWQVAESKAAVRCVSQATCDELQTGTPCYDPAVYVW